MKLETTLTIGGRTERFNSSPHTLRTNVLVTLAQRKVSHDIRARFEEAFRAQEGNLGQFRFEDGDILVEATAPPPTVHADVREGKSPHINVRGELDPAAVLEAIMALPLAPDVRSGVIALLDREGAKPGFHTGPSFSIGLSETKSAS